MSGNPFQEMRKEALTLNGDEITDTQGYDTLPVVSVCDVTLISLG